MVKGFLTENPGFQEGLPEKGKGFEQEQEQQDTTRQQCLQHGGGYVKFSRCILLRRMPLEPQSEYVSCPYESL